MKKCKGCGVILQNTDVNIKGFVNNLDQDYCKRCFRLIHYSDIKLLTKEKITNTEIKDIYSTFDNDVFVVVVDAFDALVLDKDNLLDNFKNRKIILVINKIDLLPTNIKDSKLDLLYEKIISRCKSNNIIDCFLTCKSDYGFRDFFFDAIKDHKTNKFVFVGRVNAGKSTIINKLIDNDDLTTSFYPGTTVYTNEIIVDNYKFIDTPGLNDKESFVSYVDINQLKKLNPLKTIKPKTYQLYENQSYFVEGLLRLDILTSKNTNVTFYMNNELNIHRSKYENAENYSNRNFKNIKLKLIPFISNKFSVYNELFICVKGLGLIKVNGRCKIDIKVRKGIKPYISEVSL